MDSRAKTPHVLAGGNRRQPLRIEVRKTLSSDEIFSSEPPEKTGGESRCPLLRQGDAFLAIDPGGKKPEDFPCPQAWHVLFENVLTLQLGGDFPGFAKGTCLVSCPSGTHPVIFALSREDSD